MSKVGNQTNSQDPQAVNSRVFVGNLNTFQCSKTDVERMFQRYGRLAGELIVWNFLPLKYKLTEDRPKISRRELYSSIANCHLKNTSQIKHAEKKVNCMRATIKVLNYLANIVRVNRG